MKVWSSRELLKLLQHDGWYIKRQRGSHIQLMHPKKTGKVTIPHPNRDLNTKTALSILQQANLKGDK